LEQNSQFADPLLMQSILWQLFLTFTIVALALAANFLAFDLVEVVKMGAALVALTLEEADFIAVLLALMVEEADFIAALGVAGFKAVVRVVVEGVGTVLR